MFRDILMRLRIGNATLEDYKVLKTRMVELIMYREKIFSIFYTKKTVTNQNDNASLKHPEHLFLITAIHSGSTSDASNPNDFRGLVALNKLSVGIPVMLTKNINVKVGLANGLNGNVVVICDNVI